MSDTIITIRDASVRFNLAMQRQMSLKDQLARLVRKDLRFQEFFALKHIDLQVKRGESWGFVGGRCGRAVRETCEVGEERT